MILNVASGVTAVVAKQRLLLNITTMTFFVFMRRVMARRRDISINAMLFQILSCLSHSQRRFWSSTSRMIALPVQFRLVAW